MVTDATKLILPNTGKTTEELETIWNQYVDQSELSFDAGQRKRNRFHENLKKDVMLIKAAFLQSYLIREEQNQKGDVDTELYRIQAIDTTNILDLHSKEVGWTFCNKRGLLELWIPDF